MTLPIPTDPATLRAVVGKIATQVEDAMRRDLTRALHGNDPLLAEVLKYALFGGGKRLRPLLVVLSSRLCGRHDADLYLLASAFEYLHVATLIHDDVIDHADQRRGRPSVGTKYGMAAAILAGDWLHARSMHLIGRLTGTEGLEIFCGATAAMVDGEFLQLRHVADIGIDENRYFEVIQRKTGRLIASTCEIGALYAGADQARIRALGNYGTKIGAAFQVVDDLLDYQGDQDATGKKVGNDFIEGKLTLPLLHALLRASPAERERLADLITGDRTQPEAYARLYRCVEKLGGFSSARSTAEDLVEEAVTELELFSGSDDRESHGLLIGLARFILERNR